MSDLRTAALRALEAMSSFENGTNGLYKGEFAQEIAALKVALAEPFSPEAISTTQTAWKMGYEARKAEEQADPEPPPEAQTEAEKIAYCAGWWAALEKARKAQPAQEQAEQDHETRAEIAEQQVVQLAEERDHYRDLWLKAKQAEPVKPVQEPCRYPNCVDNGPDGKCTRWLLAECSMSEDYKPHHPAAPIIKPEIKEDNSVPQAQQFLYNAWADEQIQKEKK